MARAEQIAGENPSYRIGGTGKDGTCDCIGLVIGAIRRAGGKWTGRKGTNYAARNEMRNLSEIAGSANLQPGEVVFKAREPGESGYDAATIARSYASSEDRRDYYHIGIVLSAAPLRILHMTTPRAAEDRKLGKWRFHGQLKKVDYMDAPLPAGAVREDGDNSNASGADGEEDVNISAAPQAVPGTAFIYGGNEALPVNQRAGASRRSRIIARIPQRSEVRVLSRGEDWWRVSWGGRAGYVMACFLHADQAA